MTYERPTPTTEQASDELYALLNRQERASGIGPYFREATAEMKEASTVVDRRRVVRSTELLSRNLVNAVNNAGEAGISLMGDSYKEAIQHGEAMTGVDFSKIGGVHTMPSAAEALENLQVALSGELELPVDLDPAILNGMIDALMFANEQMLDRPDAVREPILRHTDLRHYVDNIVSARAVLQPQA